MAAKRERPWVMTFSWIFHENQTKLVTVAREWCRYCYKILTHQCCLGRTIILLLNLGLNRSLWQSHLYFLFHSEISKDTMPQREAVHLAVFNGRTEFHRCALNILHGLCHWNFVGGRNVAIFPHPGQKNQLFRAGLLCLMGFLLQIRPIRAISCVISKHQYSPCRHMIDEKSQYSKPSMSKVLGCFCQSFWMIWSTMWEQYMKVWKHVSSYCH